MSPFLFVIEMDEVIEEVARRMGEEKMKCLIIAGDLMAWGKVKRKLY